MEIIDPVIYEDKLVEGLVPTINSRYNSIKIFGDTIKDPFDTYEFYNSVFSKVTFDYSEYKNVTFVDCLFEGCNLSNLGLYKCTLKRCKFIRCNMVGMSLIECPLEHFKVVDSKCDYINIANNRMKFTLLKESRFLKGRMYENSFKNVYFENLDLNEVEFIRTPLKGIDISTCKTENINIDLNSIYGAIIEPIQAFDIVTVLGVEFK